MAHNKNQPIGDPSDPQGMVAMMEQFFEWMRVELSRSVPSRCAGHTFATSSTGLRPEASASRRK